MIWPLGCGAKTAPVTKCIPVMGTFAHQEVYGINSNFAVEKGCLELSRLDSLWSPDKPDNIVDLIGKSAGISLVPADPDTLQIIATAKEFATLSGGAFDITADPIIRLWREAARKKQPPGSNEIENVRGLGCIEDLQITGTHVFLRRKGQGIDLGGIGKGYAADRVRRIYQDAGIRHAIINIGGNVLVMNSKPDGSPWKIGIKNPLLPNSKLIGYIEGDNCSVVTSGDYERFFQYTDHDHGTLRFHHIIDPRTGIPANSNIRGVTVMSASSTSCDALATAAFILGLEKGMALCNSFEDTHVLFIDKSGMIHMSHGMADRFKPIISE